MSINYVVATLNFKEVQKGHICFPDNNSKRLRAINLKSGTQTYLRPGQVPIDHCVNFKGAEYMKVKLTSMDTTVPRGGKGRLLLVSKKIFMNSCIFLSFLLSNSS